MEEEQIKQDAIDFARKVKKSFANKFTKPYPVEDMPVSVFMAGSPGAGKTESSKRLLEDVKFLSDNQKIMRIDPDEFRGEFSSIGYSGSNSHLFQAAVSTLASAIHDNALENKQSFIFDGTFANIEKARENIQRSLKRGRFVQIFYVYQNPIQAWNFVQKREGVEGRKIKKEDFIEKYFLARDVVNNMKVEFGKKIRIDLLIKNTDGSDKVYKENIDKIDNYIYEKYTKEVLENLI